jgi:hypothetical protein
LLELYSKVFRPVLAVFAAGLSSYGPRWIVGHDVGNVNMESVGGIDAPLY